MALTKCLECGKEISSKASACPHCGCPLGQSGKKDDPSPVEPSTAAKPTSKGFGASCLGCFGILALCVVIGWIAEIAGCNPETPHSDSYQAGFTVGKLEGFMAYRGGKYHAGKDDLDASARRTMGGVQFDPAKGGLEDWIQGYQVGYDIGCDQAKSSK